jgi:phosphohistidine phosphatase SixA
MDGSIGAAIPGVVLTFVKEDGSMFRTVTTNNNGYYRIRLHRGRYWVRAVSPLYEDYCSLPGFFVVTGPGYQTGNIFLKKPRVTTLLLIRHAERSNGSLSPGGEVRAQKLIHTLHKAGVTAVYASEYPRTQLTVQPLADILKIKTVVYYSEQELVNLILSDHNGDVVLAAGHSNTVSNIMSLFGASGIPPDYSNDFDNLFVVTRRAVNTSVQTNVINLQYGEPSAPDGEKKGNTPLTTFLLVRDLTAGNVASQAGKLVHAAFKLKANMTTLYAAASPGTSCKLLFSR